MPYVLQSIFRQGKSFLFLNILYQHEIFKLEIVFKSESNYFQPVLKYLANLNFQKRLIKHLSYLSIHVEELEREPRGRLAARNTEAWPSTPGDTWVRLALGRAAQGVVVTFWEC